MRILFEDNHLLVVYKPCGIATQPSPSSEESVETLMKQYIKEKQQKKGNVFLHAIYRLDKPVAGIVLFAKSQKALSRLQAATRERAYEKKYLACVEGDILSQEGVLEDYLEHRSHHAVVVSSSHPNAKHCLLRYRVLERKGHTTLLEIQLETGRYHQIRCQLAHFGHPILGDKKYKSTRAYLPEGIALCHACLTCTHPVTKEVCVFDSYRECAKTLSSAP